MTDDDSLVGQRIGVYELQALIGAGGMGRVYRARDTRLQRDVAVKILPASVAGDSDRLTRFEREARLLASFNHPNIGAIYGVEDHPPALVLELIDGVTLADRIAAGPLPIPECLGLARQIAIALDAAHEKNIIHRDLKPANIKVTPDGTVKILDFGIAKAVSVDPHAAATITSNDTRAGVVIGTAAYMSPEQARGLTVDKRTDIWAFGCVLFEMLTGRSPFAGPDHVRHDRGHARAGTAVVIAPAGIAAAHSRVAPALPRKRSAAAASRHRRRGRRARRSPCGREWCITSARVSHCRGDRGRGRGRCRGVLVSAAPIVATRPMHPSRDW